jgi:integrase
MRCVDGNTISSGYLLGSPPQPIFSVAVKKKLCPANPCAAVEFPTLLKDLFRPPYGAWSEQKRIEVFAPPDSANVICIITETGLRVYKELTPMRKDQVDLVNAVVWIPESKTPNGVAEVPLTEIAVRAFRSQFEISGPGRGCFRVTVIRLGISRPLRTCGKRPCGGWHSVLAPVRSSFDLRYSAKRRRHSG